MTEPADLPAARRPRIRHVVAGLAVAALAALVVIALGASETAPGPDRGDFAAAATEPAITLPGATPRAPGAAALELHVGGHRLTALSA
jgi:ferric-dicitrate binding protein FerR (iron transport regulator)